MHFTLKENPLKRSDLDDFVGCYFGRPGSSASVVDGSRHTRVETERFKSFTYDALMKRRLAILAQHKLTIADIQEVIASMGPLDGAKEFLTWLRERCQVVILSDTFYQFALPLMRQLGFPTLFCNQLEIDGNGNIVAHHMRMQNQKKHSVAAFKTLNFFTMAAGDAYNDTAMLGEADAGFFFCPPEHLPKEFPQFPVTRTYAELQARFATAGNLSR